MDDVIAVLLVEGIALADIAAVTPSNGSFSVSLHSEVAYDILLLRYIAATCLLAPCHSSLAARSLCKTCVSP